MLSIVLVSAHMHSTTCANLKVFMILVSSHNTEKDWWIAFSKKTKPFPIVKCIKYRYHLWCMSLSLDYWKNKRVSLVLLFLGRTKGWLLFRFITSHNFGHEFCRFINFRILLYGNNCFRQLFCYPQPLWMKVGLPKASHLIMFSN